MVQGFKEALRSQDSRYSAINYYETYADEENSMIVVNERCRFDRVFGLSAFLGTLSVVSGVFVITEPKNKKEGPMIVMVILALAAITLACCHYRRRYR